MCRFWLSGKASPCEIGLSWFQDWDSPAQLMRDPLSHAGLWTRKCLIIFHTWKTTICTISFLVCEIRKKGRTKINQNKTGVQKCFLPAKFYRSSTANNNFTSSIMYFQCVAAVQPFVWRRPCCGRCLSRWGARQEITS